MMTKDFHNGIEIMKYSPCYEEDIVKLWSETAIMGRPMGEAFVPRTFFGRTFMEYYLLYEPESTFVAIDLSKDKAIGYIAGCKNTVRYKRIVLTKILPKFILRFILKGLFLRSKNLKFILKGARSLIFAEYKTPQENKLIRDYPAHLHINISKDYRNLGVGGKLMDEYICYLKRHNITGVHLSTIFQDCNKVKNAFVFFKNFGFVEWSRKRFTMYDEFTSDNVYMITMVKSLKE